MQNLFLTFQSVASASAAATAAAVLKREADEDVTTPGTINSLMTSSRKCSQMNFSNVKIISNIGRVVWVEWKEKSKFLVTGLVLTLIVMKSDSIS